MLGQQECVVFGDPSQQSLLELFPLGLQPATRQSAELLRIAFSSDDRLNHVPARPAHHISGHRGELDVGIRQEFLNAVDHRTPLTHQLAPLPRQIAQLANRLGRNEARLQQPVLQPLRNSLAVLHVGLAARHRLVVLGVDQQQLEVTLQPHPPPRLPLGLLALAPAVAPSYPLGAGHRSPTDHTGNSSARLLSCHAMSVRWVTIKGTQYVL